MVLVLTLRCIFLHAAVTFVALSLYTLAPVTDIMKSTAAKVIDELLPATGVTQASSTAWQRLAYLTDTFGPRFSGSSNLENALTWIHETALSDSLKVTEMNTTVPKWVRGEEFGYLLQPRFKKLHLVGLGMCTPGNVTAKVFVVSGHDDLMQNCSAAKGTIVLFNVAFTDYGETVVIRYNAGVWAEQCGAVGALIRSIGPFSMQSPHTGLTSPSTIPSAAISIEDAAQLQRMFNRGQEPVVNLYLDSQTLPDSPSRNLLIDLVGSELPNEYVLISGHGDSWDIAEGAMDDGGGFVSAWEAVRVLRQLGMRPKRTIRAVVWVNEENGGAGGNQYLHDLNATGALQNHSMAIETDGGAFQPWGLSVSCATDGVSTNGGCDAARAQLQLIGSTLLASIGSGSISSGGEGADIEPSCRTGIPCAGVNVVDMRLSTGENNPCTADSRGDWTAPASTLTSSYLPYDSGYFFYHHTESDTVERIDPRQLNHMSAALAIWAFSIAELPTLLPRDDKAAPSSSASSSSLLESGMTSGGIAALVLGLLAAVALAAYCLRHVRGGSLSSGFTRRDKLAVADMDEGWGADDDEEDTIEFARAGSSRNRGRSPRVL